MMKLDLQRTERDDRYTMGRLAIDGEPFCDTLEPTDRLTDSRQTLRQLMTTLTHRPQEQEISITIN